MFQKIAFVTSCVIISPILLTMFYFFATIFLESKHLSSLGILWIILSAILGMVAGAINVFGKHTRHEFAELQRDFNTAVVKGQFGRATHKYAEGMAKSFSTPWMRILNTASAVTLAIGIGFVVVGLA